MKTQIKTSVPLVSLTLGLAMATSGVQSVCAQAGGNPDATKSKWESSAAVGLTLTKGNSDTVLVTGNVQTQRKWTRDELSLGLDGAYGENDGEKNNQSLRSYAQWNHLFNDRLFGGLRTDFLHDDIADVDYRVTLSPLLGYYFIKKEATRLSAEVGPGFIFERQGNKESQYTSLRLGERFEHRFSLRARLWQSLEFLPQVDDFENFLLLAEMGVEASLTESSVCKPTCKTPTITNPPPAANTTTCGSSAA